MIFFVKLLFIDWLVVPLKKLNVLCSSTDNLLFDQLVHILLCDPQNHELFVKYSQQHVFYMVVVGFSVVLEEMGKSEHE